jgi:hypothetical protein
MERRRQIGRDAITAMLRLKWPGAECPAELPPPPAARSAAAVLSPAALFFFTQLISYHIESFCLHPSAHLYSMSQ